MIEVLKPSDVLDRAADLIEPEGAWCQGVLARSGDKVFPTGSHAGWRDANCFCLSGALLIVAGENHQADTVARSFIGEVIGRKWWEVDWNDRPERTQPEVVAALRKAADLARSEGQ